MQKLSRYVQQRHARELIHPDSKQGLKPQANPEIEPIYLHTSAARGIGESRDLGTDRQAGRDLLSAERRYCSEAPLPAVRRAPLLL